MSSRARRLAVVIPERILGAAFAALLGVALVYLAGFAPIEAVHNRAHDARHSAVLPCH